MREADLFEYTLGREGLQIMYTEKKMLVYESFEFAKKADNPEELFTLTVWPNFTDNIPYIMTLDHEDFDKCVKIDIPQKRVTEALEQVADYCRREQKFIPVARRKSVIQVNGGLN